MVVPAVVARSWIAMAMAMLERSATEPVIDRPQSNQ
jgi:hypothetical protein